MRKGLLALLILSLVSVVAQAAPSANGVVITPNLDEPRLNYKVFEGQRYASGYVIINHIVAGNSTEILVSNIEIDDTFLFDIFDPELLGG